MPDNDIAIKAEAELVLAFEKLFLQEIDSLQVCPPRYVISKSKADLGVELHEPKMESSKLTMKTTITAHGPPSSLYDYDTELDSYYGTLKPMKHVSGNLLDESITTVIHKEDDDELHDVEVCAHIPNRFVTEKLDYQVIFLILGNLLCELSHKQNRLALLGSGEGEPVGVFTLAKRRHNDGRNKVEIPTGTHPDADDEPNLDYLTKGLDKMFAMNPLTRNYSIHLNNNFAQTLRSNTIKDLPANEKNAFNEILRYRSRALSAIYTHKNCPVFEAPTLDSFLAPNAKLGVGGDFSNFWVFLGPINISMMPSNKPGHVICSVSQKMDSELTDWCVNSKPQDSLFYIEGSDN